MSKADVVLLSGVDSLVGGGQLHSVCKSVITVQRECLWVL